MNLCTLRLHKWNRISGLQDLGGSLISDERRECNRCLRQEVFIFDRATDVGDWRQVRKAPQCSTT